MITQPIPPLSAEETSYKRAFNALYLEAPESVVKSLKEITDSWVQAYANQQAAERDATIAVLVNESKKLCSVINEYGHGRVWTACEVFENTLANIPAASIAHLEEVAAKDKLIASLRYSSYLLAEEASNNTNKWLAKIAYQENKVKTLKAKNKRLKDELLTLKNQLNAS